MPQLDILIWLSLCVGTTILFWSVYYIVIRWFIVHYYFIFNIRLKIKNMLFLLNFVLFSLVFKNNFLQLKIGIIYNISILKNIYIFLHSYIKSFNTLYTLRTSYLFNSVLLRVKTGFVLHNFFYSTYTK